MNNTETALLEAQKIASAYWPLSSFIAMNHLWEYRGKNFFDLQNHVLIDYLPSNCQYKKLLKTFPEIHNTSINKKIQTPVKLYAEQINEFEFKPLTEFITDKLLTIIRDYYNTNHQQTLKKIWASNDKENSEAILKIKCNITQIDELVKTIGINNNHKIEYFKKIYIKLYGWSSFSKWLQNHPKNPFINKQSILHEIVLIWIFYEAKAMLKTKKQLRAQADREACTPPNPKRSLQHALENEQIIPIKKKLANHSSSKQDTPEAQFIFCIDTRSEGIRRHIESAGNYQTYGCAGFFGVIFELINNKKSSYQSPALITPEKKARQKNKKPSLINKVIMTCDQLAKQIKDQLYAPLALFEIIGIWHIFGMIYKTIIPKLGKSNHNIKANYSTNNFSLDEKTSTAYRFLQSIDLIKNFSDHIIICGHQTDTTNNPFNSALNCGACGGNSGVANTQVICKFLNDPLVRTNLNKHYKTTIPNATHFYPACHHTANDRIEYLKKTPPISIINDVKKSCLQLRLEKKIDHPFLNNLRANEKNWAELIPELGLINNAYFIIGPREISKHIDLKRRAFLHSYNPLNDPGSEILTSIFSGPCIVAHWINMQYFLSSTNPKTFGAGNKAIHNVIPNIGVMEGNLSDLKIGLPLQSIHYQGELIHQPVRLCYFVYASQHQIDIALKNSLDFNLLVTNEWVTLIPLRPQNK